MYPVYNQLDESGMHIDKFEVGQDCPYYINGYTEAWLYYNMDGSIYDIVGP